MRAGGCQGASPSASWRMPRSIAKCARQRTSVRILYLLLLLHFFLPFIAIVTFPQLFFFKITCIYHLFSIATH